MATRSPNRSRSSSPDSFVLLSDDDVGSPLSIPSEGEHDSSSPSPSIEDVHSEDDSFEAIHGIAYHDDEDEDHADGYASSSTDHGFDKLSIGSFSQDDSDGDDILSLSSSDEFDADSAPAPADTPSPYPRSPSLPPSPSFPRSPSPVAPFVPPPPSSPPLSLEPLSLLSCSRSPSPALEAIARQRKNPRNSHAEFVSNPFTLVCRIPAYVTRKIFSYLDPRTLHSTLTVSRRWFQSAAEQLYRDPFNSGHGTENSDFSRPPLNPAKERHLVRLLLRSIQCPSEPGEKTDLVNVEVDGVVGTCRVVGKDGKVIRTSTNYMRFLEVFDWAPWRRYLNYWESYETNLYEITEGWEVALDAARDAEEDQSDDVLVHEMLRAAMCHKRGASPFRFSYNTLLDWFAENPRAHTVVMHPDMMFTDHIAKCLPQWTTLCFDKAAAERAPCDYLTRFDPMAFLQALLEHESRGSDAMAENQTSGIRHLQLPSVCYYNGLSEQAEEVRTMLQVVQRPVSLDVSALPSWSMVSLDFPDSKWQDLVRYISMDLQDEPETQLDFLCRCPNLREIEMMVRNSKEVEFGQATQVSSYWIESPPQRTAPPIQVARLYTRARNQLFLILEAMVFTFSASLRELKVCLDPTLSVRTVQVDPPTSTWFWGFTICDSTFAMPQLQELHLELTSSMRLHGANPFAGCPRLRRLTLISLVEDQTEPSSYTTAMNYQRLHADQKWRAPATLRELTLCGYELHKMFDMSSLDELYYLESLTLTEQELMATLDADREERMTAWATTARNAWQPSHALEHLKTVKLSGSGAAFFSFRWLPFFPVLEDLVVDGLEYSTITMACSTPLYQPLYMEMYSAADICRGPKFCKFTIRDMPCPLREANSSRGYLTHLLPEKRRYSDERYDVEDWPRKHHKGSNYMDDLEWRGLHNPPPPVNQNILKVLRQYCPNVQQLAIHLERCSCPSNGGQMRHIVDLEWGTLTYLKQAHPNLVQFRTNSLSIDVARLSLLKQHGFVRRVDSYTDELTDGCVYWVGEVDFVRSIRLWYREGM
ncbi:MAG: hypothetical protein J3Q66DRAFT_351192 [Benniella sp.]|nr:MAG: hypothetical protein J3Q66DRAFT_351192 [Benniella sp.]